jgi:hypothetical protein
MVVKTDRKDARGIAQLLRMVDQQHPARARHNAGVRDMTHDGTYLPAANPAAEPCHVLRPRLGAPLEKVVVAAISSGTW